MNGVEILPGGGRDGRVGGRQRNEERAGSSVSAGAANYNHSCGWRDEATPRRCARRGGVPATDQDDEERRTTATTKRPLPGGWKRVYLPSAGTHRRHRGRT